MQNTSDYFKSDSKRNNVKEQNQGPINVEQP